MNLYFVLGCQVKSEIIDKLKRFGNVILVYPYSDLHDAVKCHADMQITQIDRKTLVYAKGLNEETLVALRKSRINIIQGNTKLFPKYPENIAYNVLKVGRNIYHNTKYTDCIVKKELYDRGFNFIHVRQGYAGCSSIYIKDFILTTDKGILKKANMVGDECFWFDGEDIILKGYDRGFIGGCSGFIEDLGLLLTGRLEYHKEGRQVKEYLSQKGIHVIELDDSPMEDIGGIQIYKL